MRGPHDGPSVGVLRCHEGRSRAGEVSEQTSADDLAAAGPFGYLGSWLVDQPELHARRAPGNTCLAALRHGGNGRIDQPINGSKGCGGVMRVAPVGLLRPQDPFRLAAQAAALTHGHPSGYLAAGALALMVSVLYDGGAVDEAAEAALTRLAREPRHDEVARALEQARTAAHGNPPTAASWG